MPQSLSLNGLVRPHKRTLVFLALMNALISVSVFSQAYTLSLVLTRVFVEGAGLEEIQNALIGFALSSVLRGILVHAAELGSLKFAGRIKHSLRADLLSHLAALGPGYTKSQRSGELTHTLTEGVDALEAYFNQFLPQISRAALIPGGILLIVLSRDLTSGLILLLTAPLIPLFMILIGNLAEGITRKQFRTMSLLSAHFLDILQGLETLKIFGRAREQVRTIQKISGQYRQTTMGVLRVAFLSALVLEMLATLSTALVAVQIGVRLLTGRFDLQTAFFILFLAPEFYQPLRSLGSSFHTGTAGRAAAERIFDILGRKPQLLPGKAGIELPARVHFQSVSFHYDGGRLPALENVSFTLEPGITTALIGPSGAGKSTITQLLLRFLSPSSGKILAGDAPLGTLDPEQWRRQLAWVSQTPYLFQGSIADNIRLGLPDASFVQVQRAAEQAHALDFIHSFPQGFDTPIGEKGSRLSGGQAQRIALARAFLKDAALIILDEPTANLDPRMEKDLQPVFVSLAYGKMVLLISHRLHTILPAGNLVVLRQGQIVETGKPADLMETESFYASLLADAEKAL